MLKMNSTKLKESWILCFILGIVMLNYPFLHIFNKTASYFGIPVLILYFFIGWPVSIAVIFLFAKSIDSAESVKPEPNSEEDDKQ